MSRVNWKSAVFAGVGLFGMVCLCSAEAAAKKNQRKKKLLDELRDAGYQLVWSTNGGSKNKNYELYLSRGDGSEYKNITNTADKSETFPRVNPQTGLIAFSTSAFAATKSHYPPSGKLTFMTADGKNLETIDKVDMTQYKSWNPEGTKLALSYASRKKFGFRIYDTKTKTAKLLAKDKRAILDIDWSPDGKLLAFAVRKSLGLRYTVLTMNVDGTHIRPFYMGRGGNCHPCWHPKEMRLTWNNSEMGLAVGDYDPNGKGKIQAKNVRSLLPRRITGWEDPSPRWSRDCKYILYVNHAHRLCVVRVADTAWAELRLPKGWKMGLFQYDWVKCGTQATASSQKKIKAKAAN